MQLRLLLALSAAPTLAAAQVQAPVSVRTVTDTLIGRVGGVAVDRSGLIYVADFGNHVYKVHPDGRTELFASGLYGASGNAIDSRGRLLQSNFYGDAISRIDRDGTITTLARGLAGPVGIAVDSSDNLTVTNCRTNSLSRVTPAGDVSTFATSSLFNCPNGITRTADGNFHVVNFADGRVLKVTPDGTVSEFALVPGGGLGHIAQLRGAFYVTAFQSHQLYRVDADGVVTRVAGAPQSGEVDGEGSEARFTFPNGIASGPTGDRLYINDFLNRSAPTVEAPPVPKSIVRQVTLPAFWQVLAAELSAGGVTAMESRYRAWKADPSTAGGFTEQEINAFAYQLMNNGNLPAARVLFRLNTESYPGSFNTWDSYAEWHLKSGQRDEAIRLYRKSLELNPANTNATEQLRQLGAS
jgi:sugar lactone lactonase YvrE